MIRLFDCRSAGLLVLALMVAVGSGCRNNAPAGLSYDPPGSTVTTDKPIERQERRLHAYPSAGVYADNRFAGARLTRFEQVNDSVYTALITPENAPINNSAWYAFRIWADAPRRVSVHLTYADGSHRYVPKLSRDGATWTPIAPGRFTADTTDGTARLVLDVGPDTLWVAGQELRTSAWFDAWTADLTRKPHVTRRVIGASRGGTPLHLVEITDNPAPDDYVLVISRQHPPEVTGTHAVVAFLETLAADTDLARRFRERFAVWAVPLVNPDGADQGHWRHNTGGVDLNRDWLDFNQPETRQVADAFLTLKDDPANRVYFGADFHSTQSDVFYTLDRRHTPFPEGLIDRWLDAIRERLPDYYVNDDPYDLGSPVSKNWFFEAFGATPVTYEVGDEVDREQIRLVATTAAETLMELLLAEPARP